MTRPMIIRDERDGDAAAIRAIIADAFAPMPFASGTEALIVEELRRLGGMTLSLVCEEGGVVVGHVAFSPVTIGGVDAGWHALGPLAVAPDRQRQGYGSALVREGLARVRALGSQGCVLLGDPAYYGRFGFRHDPRVTAAEGPPSACQILSFGKAAPEGEIAFHPAFAVSGP